MANEAALAEYKAIRSEIEQLNGQIFATISSSLTLNLAILGFFLEKAPTSYVLPTVGIILLFFGNLILLNRNRGAHRLAYFQKYFIESRIPDICWGRVYFAYRPEYDKRKTILTDLSERLAESGTWLLVFSALINVIVLIYFGYVSKTLGPGEGINFFVACVMLGLQLFCTIVMTNYDPIDQTMRALAERAQIELDN